ncbi:unnamed protein product, partial [Hapterophycus canaliculatus]
SPTAHQHGANETRSGPGEASSHNSVDELLRRIARDVSARKARADSSRRERHHESSDRNSDRSSDQVTKSNADRRGCGGNGSRQWQHNQHPHRPSQDSSRKSRWGSASGHHVRSKSGELGTSARTASGDSRGREASAPGAAAVSVAEANPFTERMWEDASCRQVLQAMYFAPNSAVPAGSTEEFKELEEFVPKFLARREKAKEAASRRGAAAPKDASRTTHPTTPPGDGTVSTSATTAPVAAKPLPLALSALPGSFHKRYLMNFTVLSPEQQRAAQEAARAQQRREAEEMTQRRGGDRQGRRGGGPRIAGWGDAEAAANHDFGKAALRELSRRGVLERDEVKKMLAPGPLQDFRGSVLQAFIDFRMRRSLAKVVKIRRDRASLPIAAYQEAIVRTVASNPCVLVAGDTGCGKSTQVPQYLLQAGYGRVACTQPRRISAMGLCRRVSYETLHEHGSEVAYQVRFDSSRRRSSRILFLTEGLLLRQIASDPNLSAYSVVIVDEVHERHSGCDFLLGLLRAVLRRRPDLKVVLMSATINPELFSRFFDGAPLIRVPGRMHPVEIRYVPTAADNDIQEVVSRHDGEGQRKLRSRGGGGGGGEGKRVLFDARPYVKV